MSSLSKSFSFFSLCSVLPLFLGSQTQVFAQSSAQVQVGAYYFTTFFPHPNEITENSERVYGRARDHWAGVRDMGPEASLIGSRFADILTNAIFPTQSREAVFERFKPLIGYYDNSKPETVSMHLRQAGEAGIDYFSLYYYWNRSLNEPLFKPGLDAYLAASSQQRDVTFNVTVYAHPWDDRMHIPPSDFSTYADRLVSLFKRPDYTKVGLRPVIGIGDARNIGHRSTGGSDETVDVDQVIDFIKAIEDAARLAKLQKPVVVLHPWGNWHQVLERSKGSVSAVSCLALGIPSHQGSYDKVEEELVSFAKRAKQKRVAFHPCAVQDFNESPRYKLFADKQKIGDIRVLTGRTPEKFRRQLEKAKEIASSQPLSSGRLVNIYAWNEWHEGGILEPNEVQGYRELDIVESVFKQ
jgi:hypothetical protein